MSWLRSLFSRPAAVPVEQIAGIISRIAERVSSLQEYRDALAKAAQAGDLDGPFETVSRANKRARDFINDG